MISITDYTDANHRTDWKAYRSAQVAVGEVCRTCRALLLFGARGCPRECHECLDIRKQPELRHSQWLRCPKCNYTWNPGECDDYEVYQEGEHTVFCGHCSAEFEVSTIVSYLFVSPELA